MKNVLSLFHSLLYRSGSLIFGLFSIILRIICIVLSSDLSPSGGGLLSMFILVSCSTGGDGVVDDSVAVAAV